jgi:hypothetical protein
MPASYVSGSYSSGSVIGIDNQGYLPRPNGFTFDPGFTIYGDGSTTFNFDSLYDGISVTDYYVSQSGSDSNDGLTALTPKKGIDNAMAVAVGAATPWVRINIAAGDYGQSDHPGASGVAGKNVIFKATGGNVRTGPFVKGSSLTWTNVGSNTYSATRSSVGQVRDYNVLNSWGDPTRYVIAASLAECQSTAGSWFQSGSTVYVHRLDDTSPSNANIFLILAASNTTFSSNYTWIFDGGASNKIELIGGATGCLRCTGGGVNQKLYCRNTWFRFSTAGNNLHCYGVPYVLLQGGGGSGSYTDVLNYHIESGRIVNMVEIGVTCYDAGIEINGTGSDNCSTLHDGCKGIRILGSYDSADGPVVADVNDDTQSWNILCDSRNSVKGDDSGTDASWLASTGAAKMWLDRCTFGGSSYYDLSAGEGATIYYRGSTPVSISGDIQKY